MVTELVIYVFGVYIGMIGGTPDKRIPDGLFDVFRRSSRFNFRPSKQSLFYVFGVFVDSRGGDPCSGRYLLPKKCKRRGEFKLLVIIAKNS